MRDIEISASLSCADLLNLESEIKSIIEAGVDFIHYDVVDGLFNDCFVLGDELLKQIKKKFSFPVEVHLAVNDLEQYLDPFISAGADAIAFHYESCSKPEMIVNYLQKHGVKAILAFRAETEVPDDFESLLPLIDGVLKLTVNPGYAGQTLQMDALKHISVMRKLIDKNKSKVRIQADGNVNPTTIEAIVKAGATIVTGGSSGLFTQNSLKDNVIALKQEGYPI